MKKKAWGSSSGAKKSWCKHARFNINDCRDKNLTRNIEDCRDPIPQLQIRWNSIHISTKNSNSSYSLDLRCIACSCQHWRKYPGTGLTSMMSMLWLILLQAANKLDVLSSHQSAPHCTAIRANLLNRDMIIYPIHISHSKSHSPVARFSAFACLRFTVLYHASWQVQNLSQATFEISTRWCTFAIEGTSPNNWLLAR